MNLYVFPTNATTTNGYSIAVLSDYRKLKPAEGDVVVWYVVRDAASSVYRPTDITIRRPKSLSYIRIANVLNNRVSCEMTARSLDFLRHKDVELIFCGDVVQYRVLRKLFPDRKIIVRFHNCFLRIAERIRIIDAKVGLKFQVSLKAFCELEKEIFNDNNVHKIFISEEDRNYYILMMGKVSDSEVWSFEPDRTKMQSNRKGFHFSNKIVSYGGMDIHKIDSVKWFIDAVFKDMQNALPEMEFHLWGSGTEQFNNPSRHIYGHGYYDKEGMPFYGEALYVNPDLIGGGVKIKLLSYLESGVPFITTPYGFEGYSKDLNDGKYCQVIEKEHWLDTIVPMFKSN